MTTETAIKNYNDLSREHMQSVRHFVDTFDFIPGRIFEKLRDAADGEDPLELVASPHQACPECDETDTEERDVVVGPGGYPVITDDQGKPYSNPSEVPIEVLESYGITDREDLEVEQRGVCHSCGHIGDWADFTAAGSEYGYPCGWGTLFHDQQGWLRGREHLAKEAGFLVFEHEDFSNVLLGVDGGGYDFYEDHWYPLYAALGFKWHEQDEEDAERRKEMARHARVILEIDDYLGHEREFRERSLELAKLAQYER